jgi:hypothetical protein
MLQRPDTIIKFHIIVYRAVYSWHWVRMFAIVSWIGKSRTKLTYYSLAFRLGIVLLADAKPVEKSDSSLAEVVF